MSLSSTAAVRVPTRPIPRTVARERVQPRLRVVAPAPRRTAGGLALLSVTLLGLGLLVLLLLNISIGKGAYALTELQREQRALAQEKQSLNEQIDQVGAPQELAARARRLGMVPNPNPAFVQMPDGAVKGRPEVATAPPRDRPKLAPPAGMPKQPTAAQMRAAQQSTAQRSTTKQSTTKQSTTKQSTTKQSTTGRTTDQTSGRTATRRSTP